MAQKKKKQTALGAALAKANKNAKRTANKIQKSLSGNKESKRKNNQQSKNNQNKGSKKKSGGLILSEKTLSQMQKFKNDPTYQKNTKQNSKNKQNNKQNNKNKQTKQKSSGNNVQRNALGTEAKTHTKTYHDSSAAIGNAVAKATAATKITAESTKQGTDLIKKGYDKTEVRKLVNKEAKKAINKANKEIDKARPADIKYKYKDLTMEDYNKMAVGAQTGTLRQVMKTDKDLARKVADRNVEDYVKGAGVMGALDQMTQALSVSEDPVYKYSDGQKRIIEKQKETKSYNVGRLVGTGIEFGLGGTAASGEALASTAFKTAGKAAVRQAAKQGGKKLAKTTAKNVLKETAADAIVSLPLNTLDAVKFSYKDGKIDKKALGKELAMNIGGDILLGGAVSGITHGLSAKQVRNFNRIADKLKKGEKVSEAETKFFNKHVSEIGDEIEKSVNFSKNEDKIKKGENVTQADKNFYNKHLSEMEDKAVKESQAKAQTNTSAQATAQSVKQPTIEQGKAEAPVKTEKSVNTETTIKTETNTKTGDSTPISQRDIDTVGTNRKQKAYMYDNPEVKPYFQDEARILLNDLKNNYVKGERGFSDTMYEATGNGFFGTTRQLDADVAELKDRFKWTYADVEKGLKNIIEDNGKENNAVSKRLEFLIDERLRNGYDDFMYGEKIPANDEYIALLRDKEISSFDDASFNQWARTLGDGSDIGQPENVADRINMKTAPKSGNIGQLETEIKNIDTQINELKKNNSNDTQIAELEAQKATAEQNLSIETRAKAANNGLAFDEYVKIDRELDEARKEYKELGYKANNTNNSEQYTQYMQRRVELADKIEDLCEAKGIDNIVQPSKKTAQHADDLARAANGTYSEDVKALVRTSRKTRDDFYRLCVDTFHGFEQFARQFPKDVQDKIRPAINNMRNAKNKAGGWLSVKRVSADGKITGDSLEDIMGDMLQPKNAKKYDEFQYYCANKHNISRYANGKPVFGDAITAQDSVAICKKLEEEYPDFKAKQQEIVNYFKDLQQYRVDTGLISKSSAEYLDALYPDYVPTYRVVDGQKVRIVDDYSSRTLNMSDPIKTAKGGNAELMPMHEQIANLTQYTIELGEQNRMFNMIADMQGIKATDIDPDIKLEDAFDACTYTSRETDGATSRYFTMFYDNGVARKLEISEQMYRGIKEWRKDPDSIAAMFNWKAKPVRAANSLFKNLITGWNPIFGVKNIVKDSGEALIYSKDAGGFIKSYPKAVAALTDKGSEYAKFFELYEASGGKYAHIRDDVATFDLDGTFKKVIKSPISACQRFNDVLEAIPRMSEFISTIEKSTGLKGAEALKAVDGDILSKAMYNANEVTLNFGRSGAFTKALNSTVVPYLNPSIQGLAKLGRVFRDAGTDGIKGFFSLAAKLSAFAVVPSVFNEVMNIAFGGDAYQSLNARDKDNNYFIPVGDGKFFKLPKARLVAGVTAPINHAIRNIMYGEPMDWKEMFQGMWSNVGVSNPVESNLFAPLMLVYNNKTWYGGNIENASDLDLREIGEKSKIYDETTSAIGIWIGEKFNVSPKKVDYLIDAYTGAIGDFLLPMTAQASQGNPLFKNFIVDSVFSNRLATDFWEMEANMESRSNVKGGKATEKYEDWKATYMYDAMTLSNAVSDIDNDKSLTKKEKREMKRELKRELNKYYAAALKGEDIDIEPISVIAKQIGANKALSRYLPDNKNEKYSFKEHYKDYKQMEGYKDLSAKEKRKVANEWLKTYSRSVRTQKRIDVRNHNTPDWETIAVVNALRGGKDSISKSCGVYDDTIKEAKTYVKYNGNADTYVATYKRVNKVADRLENKGTDTSSNIYKKYLKDGVSALALAYSTTTFKDRAYYITGSDSRMNAARGLNADYNWSINEVVKLGFNADSDGNTYLKKQEIIDAIENSKASTTEEKSMLFTLIAGDNLNNPYGSIGDYSIKGDTGITKERKSTSSGSGGKRTSSGKSSSKSKSKRSDLPTWEEHVAKYISDIEESTGVKLKDWDSPLDQAYTNKINSIYKKMEV